MSRKKTNNWKRFQERLKSNEETIKKVKDNKQYLNIKSTGLDIELQPNEKFKPCFRQENYWASNYGRFIHKKPSGKYSIVALTPDKKDNNGKEYYRVWVNGVLDYAHRLVAETWCKGFDAELRNEVHHLDHDSLNNKADNLKWVNKVQHSLMDRDTVIYYMSNRNDADFVEVDDIVEVADRVGVDLRVLSYVLKGKPDYKHGELDMYEFETGSKLPHIIALNRTGRQSA